MQLRSFTDYALRVLMLVGLTDDELVTIDEIAERYGISRNHLMKVIHRLGLCGYIETVRGKKGGIRLARSPESIRLGEVVRDFEGDMKLVECFESTTSECPIEPICALQGVLRESLRAFLQVLDKHTLQDLLHSRRSGLRALLGLPSSSKTRIMRSA